MLSFLKIFRHNTHMEAIMQPYTKKEIKMGMNRHDAYYEPEDDEYDQDELEHQAWLLIQKGKEYDYQTASAVSEMFGDLSVKQAEDLQAIIDTGDFEKIGRKIMTMSMDYQERWALRSLGAEWL